MSILHTCSTRRSNSSRLTTHAPAPEGIRVLLDHWDAKPSNIYIPGISNDAYSYEYRELAHDPWLRLIPALLRSFIGPLDHSGALVFRVVSILRIAIFILDRHVRAEKEVKVEDVPSKRKSEKGAQAETAEEMGEGGGGAELSDLRAR